MTLPYPFREGIYSALHCRWTLTLKTPLLIRHGSCGAYKNNTEGYKKGRGQDKEFSWQKKNNEADKHTWAEVADFNFQFSLGSDGKLTVDYSIPPSSIRGALRQWAIKQMVERNQRSCFQPPKLEGFSEEEKTSLLKQHRSEVRNYAEDTGHNWHHILSLFGNAFEFTSEEIEKIDELEKLEEKETMTWAGRLKVTTTIKQSSNLGIDGIDAEHMPSNAPDNIQRHINVRNPLDRMTMAAKDKGLHHALEMSPGQEFDVELNILNPGPKDIEMVRLWEEDINDGFLRFGGLTSQGRGRCELSTADATEYKLYASVTSGLAGCITSAEKTEDKILDGFWTGASFTRDELYTVFEKLDKLLKADESPS
ncbi:MAG: hypothetical protein C1942_02905 [Prosthecochloris sp.]|uniref:RAMP superfamily CRISPR-associated protein n=1 Tax=Prosthecochloris sp. TaxID=290513 RepID=UPI0013CC7B16|nr:RAMP superfamily CRISPR-associated protein [Prosthecochloris sp.]NEX11638.1 hypothetical protein [Prosthecochloris sp.]